MPADLRWSWHNNRNKLHTKCSTLESSCNHSPPQSMEKLPSMKPVPGVSKVGDRSSGRPAFYCFSGAMTFAGWTGYHGTRRGDVPWGGFHTVYVVSRQGDWSGLPFPSPENHVLAELYVMTCPSWVALHSMDHGFTELCKTVPHVKALQTTFDLCFLSLSSWIIEMDIFTCYVQTNQI